MAAPEARIRILFLMRGRPGVFGGGKRAFMQLMAALPNAQFDVFASCALDAGQHARLRGSGVAVCERNFACESPAGGIAALRRYLLKERIGIVHSQGPRADLYARVAAALAGDIALVNTVAMTTDELAMSAPRRLLYVGSDRLTRGAVRAFVAVSQAVRERLCRRGGIAPERVVCIPNGVDVGAYGADARARERIRHEFGFGPEVRVIGALGRLDRRKGVEVLVDAAAALSRERSNVRVLIVGTGPVEAACRERAARAGLGPRCVFAGFREDVAAVLDAMDVFVMPSFAEGHPFAVLEAMASARAIVASDIPGIREQLAHGAAGRLVPPGDAGALARGIAELLDDPAEAARLGGAARARAEADFDVRQQVAQHAELYAILKGLRAGGAG
ncbi:MAG TPA: glycosyltransferase family 4 protein [bacterium]